jgi:hypothetical protein
MDHFLWRRPVVLEGMQAGRVCQLNLENLKSKDRAAIQNRLIY